jgi:hypothetical protein
MSGRKKIAEKLGSKVEDGLTGLLLDQLKSSPTQGGHRIWEKMSEEFDISFDDALRIYDEHPEFYNELFKPLEKGFSEEILEAVTGERRTKSKLPDYLVEPVRKRAQRLLHPDVGDNVVPVAKPRKSGAPFTGKVPVPRVKPSSAKNAANMADNPFNVDNADLNRQAKLIDLAPSRARQMIVAAGRDPRLFGL